MTKKELQTLQLMHEKNLEKSNNWGVRFVTNYTQDSCRCSGVAGTPRGNMWQLKMSN